MRFIKHPIVIFPTKKESYIALENENHLFFTTNKKRKNNHQLYVLSDEPITISNWYVDLGCSEVFKAKQESLLLINTNDQFKKIIATTDESLTKPGADAFNSKACIPQLHKEFILLFIKRFNSGHKITEIMVEYSEKNYNDWELKVTPNNTINAELYIKSNWSKEEVIAFAQNYARMVQEKPIQLNAYKAIHNKEWIEANIYFTQP